MPTTSIADPVAALATSVGKRALGRLVAKPEHEAIAALAALLAQPPVEPKPLKNWSPAKHRAAIDALVGTLDRAAIDRAARACDELSHPHGLAGLLEAVGTPAWP